MQVCGKVVVAQSAHVCVAWWVAGRYRWEKKIRCNHEAGGNTDTVIVVGNQERAGTASQAGRRRGQARQVCGVWRWWQVGPAGRQWLTQQVQPQAGRQRWQQCKTPCVWDRYASGKQAAANGAAAVGV